jgi:hypothetical protein
LLLLLLLLRVGLLLRVARLLVLLLLLLAAFACMHLKLKVWPMALLLRAVSSNYTIRQMNRSISHNS